MEIISINNDIEYFISKLDKPTGAKVSRTLELLGIEEYRLSMPYSKMIERNLYELRIKSIQNIRIFYTFKNGKIFLLHIISKKTEKLKLGDLDIARRRLGRLVSI